MDRSHYDTTLSFDAGGTEVEIDVTVSFAVSVGRPASFLGPAEDDEVSDIQLVQVGGKFRPWNWLYWSDGHFADLVAERLFDSEADLERMLEIAAEDACETEERLAERAWADRSDEARP